MKPRILFISHTGALGGAELYLIDVARNYLNSSSVLLFETGPLLQRLMLDGIDVNVESAPSAVLEVSKVDGLWQGLKAMPGVVRLVFNIAHLARHYDLIFANSQKALVVGALAGFVARRPVIWNLHDMLTADHFSRFNRFISVQLGNRLVDRVIVNSHATRRAFVASGGREEKSGVVYNGLDAASLACVPQAAVRALRDELGLRDVPVVGVFGRLTPWKGQHVLLHALAALPGLHAIVVGDALFGDDGLYRDRLHRLAATLDLGDRIHFLGFRHDVRELMHLADVIVHTSVAPEPFGRVVVEGMLAGKPVVATKGGGIMEIVDDERTGLLVSPGDPHALSNALRWVFANPETAQEMACSAKRDAERRFSPDEMLEQLERQLQIVMKQTTTKIGFHHASK